MGWKRLCRKGNIIYELNNGKGLIKKYNNYKLTFEGEYLNGEKMGKEKNMMNMAILYLMVNI